MIRFCFRIAADAELAYDLETGEPADGFVQVQFQSEKASMENYDLAHGEIGNGLAAQFEWDQSWVTPISVEEYDRETSEEETK